MSHNANAYLMIGWEIETDEAVNYDMYDGYSDEAYAEIADILTSVGVRDVSQYSDYMPVNFWSLYDNYPAYMRLGFVLATSYDKGDENADLHEFASRLLANVEAYTNAAYAMYKALTGKDADTPPVLMCVGEEA